MRLDPPTRPLHDEVIVLRSARPRDAAVLRSYASTIGGLDGVWLPLAPGDSLAACRRLIAETNLAWNGATTSIDPALMMTTASSDQPIGFVSIGARGEGRVEIAYGVEPRSRRRGFATSAARLCGQRLAPLPGVDCIELHIPVWHEASVGVALRAGYRPAGHIDNTVPATGETFRDHLFVWSPPGRPEPRPRSRSIEIPPSVTRPERNEP